MRLSVVSLSSVAALSMVAVGCLATDATDSGTSPLLKITSAAVNPLNALSIVIALKSVSVDSLKVEYWSNDESRLSTPCFRQTSESTRVTVLGLRPNTQYSLRAAACGSLATSAEIHMTAGELPVHLESVKLETTGVGSSGYTLTSFRRDSLGYVVAFDSTGAIRWYRKFDIRPGEDAVGAEQLPNGDFTVFLGASTGWQPTFGRFVQFRATGDVVQTYSSAAPYYTDVHELAISFNDTSVASVSLLGYDLRPRDLSSIGGNSNVLLGGHTLLRQSSQGSVVFLWSAWDHFQIEDWIEPPLPAPVVTNIDFDHPNAFIFDQDSNYVVSFRNFGEITKIDGISGDIIWRLGGRHNQFTIVNDPLAGFSGQHSVRVLENGHILLFDNGLRHTPPESRAVEYRLDTETMTATMVWEYRHNPPLYAPFVGSVQRYEDGRTLIGFGWVSQVVEVGTSGDVRWEGVLTFDGNRAPNFYRIWKVPSLYKAQRP